ncbi:unnamed protein product [Paramecium sonneborni]|uniref:Uncharacterized protein n=1 Tax=Paramecium sonneborni TaxID=65129 RepID=A0A8S1NN01_9CILI|nr:unnamed protein product [Paramecium sonneborni]
MKFSYKKNYKQFKLFTTSDKSKYFFSTLNFYLLKQIHKLFHLDQKIFKLFLYRNLEGNSFQLQEYIQILIEQLIIVLIMNNYQFYISYKWMITKLLGLQIIKLMKFLNIQQQLIQKKKKILYSYLRQTRRNYKIDQF